MSRSDQEYIEKLRRYEAETRSLLSNAQKPERECMVVRAFLRCVGVQFSENEIQASTTEPIDVMFRLAQFQIMDVLGDHKRGLESKKRQHRYEKATRISDLEEPYSPSEPMSYGEVTQVIADDLTKKALHYGFNNCSDLDALVYVDLKGRHLWPPEVNLDEKVASQLSKQGWRSVSMLFVPYGAVISTHSEAPDFLKDKVGLSLKEWPSPDGFFEA